MATPSLSVVIPVRNGMPYLPQAVESILTELPQDGELVVRDNCSTDETGAYLAGLSDSRVRVITGSEDLTAGENWTAVCAEAKGEYVKLVCADDAILSGALARQLTAAQDAGAVMVASKRRVIDSSGATVIASHGLGGLTGRFDGKEALAKSIASGTNAFGEMAAVLVRRDALASALPFTTTYPFLTDLDLYARILNQGTFVGLDSVDAEFRVSDTSWSSEIGNRQLAEFRGWVAERQADGTVTMSGFQRAQAAVMIPAMFLARRVVNSLTARRAKRRAN
jgi:glycosyltransferase involved in cell wall biosynthesis